MTLTDARAAAAALASVTTIRDERLWQNAEKVGAAMVAELRRMQERHPFIGDVRGLGLFIGVELVKDRKTKEPNGEFVSALIEGSIQRGVIPVSCGPFHSVLRHLLPLVITDEQLDEGLDVMAEAAKAARSGS